MIGRYSRRGLLAAVGALVLSAGLPATTAATPPSIVAARSDGSLVLVAISGNAVTGQHVVVRGTPGSDRVPTQVRGQEVAFSTWDRDKNYVSLVDLRTKRARVVSKSGQVGQLFVSPDGRSHYRSEFDPRTGATAIVRTDRNGKSRRVLLPATAALSGMALSRDGRTIYVARGEAQAFSELLAVDTSTGQARTVTSAVPELFILNVVVSPDGTRLALTTLDLVTSIVRVMLIPTTGGVAIPVPADVDMFASSFSSDGRTLHVSQWGASSQLATVDLATLAVTPIAKSGELFYAVSLS